MADTRNTMALTISRYPESLKFVHNANIVSQSKSSHGRSQVSFQSITIIILHNSRVPAILPEDHISEFPQPISGKRNLIHCALPPLRKCTHLTERNTRCSNDVVSDATRRSAQVYYRHTHVLTRLYGQHCNTTLQRVCIDIAPSRLHAWALNPPKDG